MFPEFHSTSAKMVMTADPFHANCPSLHYRVLSELGLRHKSLHVGVSSLLSSQATEAWCLISVYCVPSIVLYCGLNYYQRYLESV